jgi:phosphoglycerate dehydrogenase-like enzyme
MSSATPLRILISDAARASVGARLALAMGSRPYTLVPTTEWHLPDPGVHIAFVSRDVTGLSTKHEVLPDTQRFYDALLHSASMRWVHVHSAGADRPVYQTLIKRGVQVTTSPGANAGVVAQTALAGVLALARKFPQLMAAQQERRWAPLMGADLPRELAGQTAVVVGWGAVGQRLGSLLMAVGMKVVAVRRSATLLEAASGATGATGPAGAETASFEDLATVLPRADWLLLACPLTDITRGLIDAQALARLPEGAHLVNVARGEVVDEPALVAALQSGKLAGAYLDVFAHEPLTPQSPLWQLPNVIVTPHSAGFSDGNAPKVEQMFLDNLAKWLAGEPLLHPAS